MVVTVTRADIQKVIRGIDQIEWTAYMDRAWYPLAPLDWEEEQRWLSAGRNAMSWNGGLRKQTRTAFAKEFHMPNGPTYDYGCKLLARKLLSDSKDSGNAAEGQGQRLCRALPG